MQDEYKKKSEDEECDEVSYSVKLVYAAAIIVWIFLVVWLSLYRSHMLSVIILMFPLALFFIGIFNSDVVTEEVERSIFKTNYAGVGFLFLVPLLAWVSKDYTGDGEWFTTLLMVAIILILFSLIDVWVKKKWIRTYRHAISALQTMALFLIIYSLQEYYLTGVGSLGMLC
ncbi:unnamed protein product [marine sediment metagenome]|uniref:Uncharacterized protein n=1 Tax=marine sediment metagenome TaxID=412755 RepID=X0RH04_9ZZZZ